jgi:hypothetical protein
MENLDLTALRRQLAADKAINTMLTRAALLESLAVEPVSGEPIASQGAFDEDGEFQDYFGPGDQVGEKDVSPY